MEAPSLLHPIQPPFATHALPVGNGHTLYVEESGNPQGLPALFLHGGPGSGTQPDHRGYFDPSIYHIILFDQRGCGQSTAIHPLHANTTQHLLADIETIRNHLHIPVWHVVMGNSWGSTLALLYAEAHPTRLKSLVLSSVFLADDVTLEWSFGSHGAAKLFPQEYEAVASLLNHPSDMIHALYAVFTGEDETFAREVARSWMFFDALTMEPAPDKVAIRDYLSTADVLYQGRLMLHYLSQRCFLKEGQVLGNIQKIAHLPLWLSHGTADNCCPIASSESIKDLLPQTVYVPVAGAGHRSTDALKAQRVAHVKAAALLPV